jgi:tetratricopeptide (TPR) repeat protein
LGLLPREEATVLVRDFITSLRNRHTNVGRARAALVSVRIAKDLSDISLLDQLQNVLTRLPTDSFEPRERAILLIAQAMNAFHRRDMITSNRAASTACELLRQTGGENSTLASITMGLGVIAMAEGDYVRAIPPLKLAAEVAKRLGNESVAVTAAGNLAACYYRIGSYDAQKEWALIARRSHSEWTESFDGVKSAWLLGMALAHLGDTQEAREALGLIHSEITHCGAGWEVQFGWFFCADLLWLLGEKAQAMKAASKAIAQAGRPASLGLTGHFSRWSALVAARDGSCKEQLEILLGLRQRRDYLDSLDRAELDCSVVYLRKKLGLGTEEYERDLEAALTSLPDACPRHFRILGLLS